MELLKTWSSYCPLNEIIIIIISSVNKFQFQFYYYSTINPKSKG